METYDVIVVGGGPIGSALTGSLASRGLHVVMLEQSDGSVVDARMHHVNIRTMEILRNFGLEKRMRTCGWPTDHPQDVVFATKLDGKEIARIPWESINEMTAPECSPTYAQRCPQAWFNPILTEYARIQTSADIRHYWRVEAVTQEADYAEAVAVDVKTGRSTRIRAKYLVGCDGPKSYVRSIINPTRNDTTPFGKSAEVIFRSRQLQAVSGLGRIGRCIFVGVGGLSATLMAFDGVDRYRFALMVQPEHLTDEQMIHEISKMATAPFDIELLTPVLHWSNRIMSASRYVDGRIVLAGDSAHGMPPTGGFGMNTGFVDVYDLAWRLEALVHGWGGPNLLPSYDMERKQGVARISNMAADIYQDWLHWSEKLKETAKDLNSESERGEEVRFAIGRQLSQTFYREFNSSGGPLGYRYTSAICIPDGTPEAPDGIVEYRQSARPGHRAPHAWLGPNISTLDKFGRSFVLLCFSHEESLSEVEQEAARRRVPLDVCHVSDGAIAVLYERKFVLVRPDGVVAWRGDELPEGLKGVFEVTTGHAS